MPASSADKTAALQHKIEALTAELARATAELAEAHRRERQMAGEDQRHTRAVEQLSRQLAEARDQQAASREILGIISNSHKDIQPVLDAVARCAVDLCEAERALIFLFDKCVGGRRQDGVEHCVVDIRDCSSEIGLPWRPGTGQGQ